MMGTMKYMTVLVARGSRFATPLMIVAAALVGWFVVEPLAAPWLDAQGSVSLVVLLLVYGVGALNGWVVARHVDRGTR